MTNPRNFIDQWDERERQMAQILARTADQQTRRDNPAIDDIKSIGDEIRRFEATLSSEEEVGIILAYLPGGQTLLHVQQIYRSGPRMVVFEGQDSNGRPVRLVQHHSQVTLMLTAAHKISEVANRIQIGFDISTPSSSASP